eukprot:m.1643228 g.1643228  ORF g.1643228 m.1643228 type:complete len:302 (+) comp57319_c0_seq1:267-1172(+)
MDYCARIDRIYSDVCDFGDSHDSAGIAEAKYSESKKLSDHHHCADFRTASNSILTRSVPKCSNSERGNTDAFNICKSNFTGELRDEDIRIYDQRMSGINLGCEAQSHTQSGMTKGKSTCRYPAISSFKKSSANSTSRNQGGTRGTRTCVKLTGRRKSKRRGKAKLSLTSLSTITDSELADLTMPELIQIAEVTRAPQDMVQDLKVRRRKLKNRSSARGSAQKRRHQFRVLAAANKKLESEYRHLKRQSEELLETHDQMVASAQSARARAAIETNEVQSLVRIVDHLRTTVSSRDCRTPEQS